MTLPFVDTFRAFYENLNDREKRLVTLLGIVVALLAVGLPVWLASSAIAAVSEENDDIRNVLADISRRRDLIAERQAERARAERRYDTKAPALGSFLEEHARQAGYERPLQVTDQPGKVEPRFARRHVTAELPGVGLKTAVDVMAAVESSRYPVAIESLRVEHFSSGDRYNVQLGVIAFDRRPPGDDNREGRRSEDRNDD